jgi:hypothetical protein
MTEGGGFGVAAVAVASMGRNMTAGQGDRQVARQFGQAHQIPIGAIQVPVTAGAGVYQMNDLLMPKAGYMWGIRRLSASGYSAGSVIAYKGGFVAGGTYSGGGEPFPFSAAGVATIGRGELLLDQGDALIIVCTGITLSAGFGGVQINGAADCFERWLLPDYLGISGG